VSETPTRIEPPDVLALPAPAPAAAATPPSAATRWWVLAAVALAVLATAALALAWSTQQRVKALEGELVRRQQESSSQANEARTLARQAELLVRETAAKTALLEARVAETTIQRSQFEELLQSLARSRDENVLADLDAAIRVALQQSAITGSAEPLVATLKQADERLARYNQPRLERVRRAVAKDLERTRAAGVADIGLLSIRLDDVIRQVGDLPLLAQPEARAGAAAAAMAAAPVPAKGASAAAPAPAAGWRDGWSALAGHVWSEIKGLIRVTRIGEPEAMLLQPEQAFFLRENLKLRLLNARLALLSRQFDTAQNDLRDAQTALDRYFDRGSRRVVAAAEGLRQVAAQARQVTLPRPDATLAAIAVATASAGR
jgi:uroporphyrin-III C-methyltransferase